MRVRVRMRMRKENDGWYEKVQSLRTRNNVLALLDIQCYILNAFKQMCSVSTTQCIVYCYESSLEFISR